MARVLVIGAGISGCTVAYALAVSGALVTLVEKSDLVGGKVRTYGCKAIDGKCQNCGVCLTAGLWDKVHSHKNIEVCLNTVVNDIAGYDAVVVSTGFESHSKGLSSHLHIDGTAGIITGTTIEELMLDRTLTNLFEKPPESVAFIQCVGSRDQNEGGIYCSKVCCSYSTRAAKVIRSYYPESKIVFFYMEMQIVEGGDYYAGLRELGIDFIKCRPLKVTGGTPVMVEYEGTQGDGSLVPASETGDCYFSIESREFDIVVLSDGIQADEENDKIAEICGLSQDKDGFLYTPDYTGNIFVTGTARVPMRIDEAYADAITVANKILLQLPCHCEESEDSHREVSKP